MKYSELKQIADTHGLPHPSAPGATWQTLAWLREDERLEARRQQAITDMRARCPHCGVDTRTQDCRRWCRADEAPCDCGQSLCGDCMRRGGTSTSGIGIH